MPDSKIWISVTPFYSTFFFYPVRFCCSGAAYKHPSFNCEWVSKKNARTRKEWEIKCIMKVVFVCVCAVCTVQNCMLCTLTLFGKSKVKLKQELFGTHTYIAAWKKNTKISVWLEIATELHAFSFSLYFSSAFWFTTINNTSKVGEITTFLACSSQKQARGKNFGIFNAQIRNGAKLNGGTPVFICIFDYFGSN